MSKKLIINIYLKLAKMKDLTLRQHDIAETLINTFDCILKMDAIKYIKTIFGSTFNLKDTIIAYNSIEKYK